MSKTEETITKLGISAAAMVTSAYVGSLIGDNGTLIGTGIGAVVGGAATEGYQIILDRGKHHFKSIKLRHKRMVTAGLAIVATGVVGYGGLTLVEAAANKPLHAITTGTHESGTSLGGGSSSVPEPSAPSSSASSTSSSSASPSPTSSPTLTSSPSAIPSTLTPSTPPAVIPSTSASPITSAPPTLAPTTPAPSPTGS